MWFKSKGKHHDTHASFSGSISPGVALIIIGIIVVLLLFHLRHKIAAFHDRYRANRRARYSRLSSGFQQDIDDGFTSMNFDLESANSDDSRQGLNSVATLEIKEIMESEGLTFDDARWRYTQEVFGKNDVGADGKPRDPRTVTFSG